MNYRKHAFNILIQNSSIKTAFQKEIINLTEIIAIKKISYGVMRNKLLLEHFLNFKKVHPKIKIILMIGLYELWFTKNKSHAIVNESCNFAKELNLNFAVGFINATLRKFSHIKLDKKNLDLSTRYSYSPKLVDYLIKNFGKLYAAKFCIYFNKEPKLCVRVNRINTTELPFKKIPHTKDGYFAPNLKGIESGNFFVQDIGSQLACDALGPQAGDEILDCCASPGGKLAAIASITQNQAKITACDISDAKIAKIQENITRLGIKNIELIKNDFLKVKFDKKFDKIILDAPCSGLGVLNKHIEGKFIDKDFAKFADMQFKMLEKAASLLKKNGILVYSVCTISKEETENLIAKFPLLTIDQEMKSKGFYFVKLTLKKA